MKLFEGPERGLAEDAPVSLAAKLVVTLGDEGEVSGSVWGSPMGDLLGEGSYDEVRAASDDEDGSLKL